MFKLFCKLGFHNWSHWKAYHFQRVTNSNNLSWMRQCKCCSGIQIKEFLGDPNE